MANPRLILVSPPHGSSKRDDQDDEVTINQSFSDVFFGFLDDVDVHNHDRQRIIISPESESYRSSDNENPDDEMVDQDKEEHEGEKDDRFWENQNQLLQATLRRTSSLESGIRNGTKQAINEMQISETVCGCGRPIATGCRSCLMREVSDRLRNAGYNSAVCKSKWRSSPGVASGEHTFLDVLSGSNSKKGEVRVIIELNFRAEFEMARASEEYNRLVQKLPEVFVGKEERLQSVIKMMCSAAKKCMKEKKMHLGPWRKQRYMQAKWLGAYERTTSSGLSLTGTDSGRVPRPRVKAASMLTADLLDIMPNIHCKAVAVV